MGKFRRSEYLQDLEIGVSTVVLREEDDFSTPEEYQKYLEYYEKYHGKIVDPELTNRLVSKVLENSVSIR